jgi:hypothetical protein
MPGDKVDTAVTIETEAELTSLAAGFFAKPVFAAFAISCLNELFALQVRR